MTGKDDQLHVFFFPMMAHGHMIPTLDMVMLFASRHGIKSTIVTTPLNVPSISKAIHKHKQSGFQIEVRSIYFPGVEAGLPEGVQHFDHFTSDGSTFPSFFKACSMLQEPLEQLMEELRPDCLVADIFFPWATRAAAKFGIPRLIFDGTSYFSVCAKHSLLTYRPFEDISSEDSETTFTIPHLPHQLKLIRSQLAPYERDLSYSSTMAEFGLQVMEAERTSYGVIFNSFYELEPDYVDHFKNVLGRRGWSVGPLSIQNKKEDDIGEKSNRGRKASIGKKDCIEWLDSKKPNSVVYVCFGSMANFAASQLTEMAEGIESSVQDFIWVIRNKKGEEIGEEKGEEWMPKGFEERTKGRGLIIRGWAPQVLILDHRAVGAFVTHCGWNSTLEAVCAGVPMVTWPVFAEQFVNEKLVTQILLTGVGVGSKVWANVGSDGVKREAIAEAITRVMVGEEMRRRAAALKVNARKAVEEGGSSYSGLTSLLDELKMIRADRLGSSSHKTVVSNGPGGACMEHAWPNHLCDRKVVPP
ncbi:unnamed protein product [Cuscuta europaea]|uniref:Glycosyltransferase n=1 Tax=Cuscuta europaea TaxID=41803 RepID=A0A9P0YI27_CUSEU|nr:unnamed protein product [Cuscuta europaea]